MNPSGRTNKKICLVVHEFPPNCWGGLARTAERVSRYAARVGLEVHVAHFLLEESASVLLDENRSSVASYNRTLHRFVVGRERLPDGPRALWDCPHNMTLRMMYQSLELLHGDEQFDFFQSFFLYPTVYVTGLLARRMHVPSIATLVGDDVKRYLFSPEKVAVCRSGLENADRIVALSRDLVEMADALIPIADKSRVIYNSVEIPPAAWQPKRDRNGPLVIGSAGIFKYAKGLPYLIKAAAELRQRVSVVLELPGHLRESERAVVAAMVQRTGLDGCIHFREPLAHDDIPAWLRTLDVFVLPSVSEGCPNILMEAMASGVPSVATRTGANEELMEDRISGLLVPWGNAEVLGEALGAILTDAELGASLGAAARMRMQEFSADREMTAWESVYGEIIEL
jgi:L-malate glycosyltransferase